MKFTKYFLSLAAAVGMIAGCQKQEMVQIAAPENVVAPVLEKVADIEITKDNLNEGTVTFKWAAADFGVATQINYAIEIAAAGSDTKAVLTSGINSTKEVIESVVAYADLNTFLVNILKLEPEVKTNLEFYISAKVGEYAKVYSAPVAAAVTPIDAILPEIDMYGHVNVIGQYCDWDFTKTQYVYSYEKDIYSGVVDFLGMAAKGWKLAVPTSDGKWDDKANWGLDGDAEAPAAEAKEVSLICDGGSKDLKIYSKRFYNLEFDKANLKLKVKHSFDKICVIGAYNGWNEKEEKEMKFNPTYVRFFVDVEAAEDGGLLCRTDGAWTLKFGIENKEEDIAAGLPIKEGGNDMGLKAGNYRIYLDLNKGTVIADAAMYGQPEPGYVEPAVDPSEPAEPGWVVNGSFNDWGKGEPVVNMTDKGNDVWEAKKVELTATDEFKLVLGDDWYGAAEKNATGTNDQGEAYDIYKAALGTAFDAVKDNSYNITVGVAGVYNILLDAAAKKVTVSAAPLIEGWGVIGVKGWEEGDDIAMTQTGLVWSAKGVELKANSGWKLRKDGNWDVNVGGPGEVKPYMVTVGEEGSTVVSGGQDMAVAADGTYDIYFNEALSTVVVLTAGADAPKFEDVFFLVGGHNGWGDAFGILANAMVKGKEYFELKGLELAADTEMKFSTDAWGKQLIASSFSKDAELALVDAGPNNMKVTAGKYDVYMSFDHTKAYFMTPGKTPADAGEAVITYIDASDIVVGFVGDDYGWDLPKEEYRATFVSKELTDEAKYAGTYVYKKEGLAITNGKNIKVRINGEWIGAGNATIEGLVYTGTDNITAGEGGTFNAQITFEWDGLKPSGAKIVFSK